MLFLFIHPEINRNVKTIRERPQNIVLMEIGKLKENTVIFTRYLQTYIWIAAHNSCFILFQLIMDHIYSGDPIKVSQGQNIFTYQVHGWRSRKNKNRGEKLQEIYSKRSDWNFADTNKFLQKFENIRFTGGKLSASHKKVGSALSA